MTEPARPSVVERFLADDARNTDWQNRHDTAASWMRQAAFQRKLDEGDVMGAIAIQMGAPL